MRNLVVNVFVFCLMISLGLLSSCPETEPIETIKDGEVHNVKVNIKTDAADGMTVEQRNVASRLLNDNKVGAIKHLYVMSAYSGQVILYSTVKGKVTSSGKRLIPHEVAISNDYWYRGYPIDEDYHATAEVRNDDGTYGSSNEYIYWWDTKGIYRQLYITGGMIVLISDQPQSPKSIVMNLNVENNK